MVMKSLLFLLFLSTAIAGPGPRCKSLFKISWLSKSPYLYDVEDEKIGILPLVLKHMIDECCQKAVNVTYEDLPRNQDNIVEDIMNGTSDFVLPLAAGEKTTSFLTLPYLPMVESPGMAFYIATELSAGDTVIKAIKTSSPLLVLVGVSMLIVGALFWIFERVGTSFSINKIVSDICEGIWWSFVTMTTVGYGDMYPKTHAGRTLCIIWTTTGVITCSLFTATVTSVLTSACLSETVTLQGSEVAVLEGSEEYNVAVKRNAMPVTFRSVEEIASALEDRRISSALIDSYVAGDYRDKFKNVRLQKIIEIVFSYGVILRPPVFRYERCFKDYLQSRQNFIYKHVAESIIPLKRTKSTSIAEEKSNGIFDINSPTLYMPIGVSFALLVFFSFVGVLREKLTLTKNINVSTAACYRSKTETTMDIEKKQEKEFQKILGDMYEEVEVLKAYCLDAMSTIDKLRSRNNIVQHVTSV